MPKENPLTLTGAVLKSAAESDTALQVIVAARLMKTGKTRVALAQEMGLTMPTLRKRLQNPDTFTRGEMRCLREALRLTESEARMIAL